MANGNNAGGVTGPSSLGGTNSSFVPRPQTGGPLQGPPSAPAPPGGSLLGGAPLSGGGGGLFGPAPIGAGFGVSDGGGFGFGFNAGPQLGNDLSTEIGNRITPGELVGLLPNFGGGLAQNNPINPRAVGFDNQGLGGFSASPRLLTDAEIGQINRNLGIAGTPRQFNANAFRGRQQLGPFGFIADPTTFNRTQVPFIETRLNFENLLQAQQDRQSALDLLSRQRDVIGQTPEQQLAISTATRRLENPDPFTPEEIALQTGQIRSRAGRGLESAQRQFQEDIARQGLAGSASSFQSAQLQQAADRQASDELSRFAIANALQRDANEAAAIDRLQGISGENELRQIALNQALTELLTAERGAFDLASLASKERQAERGFLSKIGFF